LKVALSLLRIISVVSSWGLDGFCDSIWYIYI
jgi:hypothetical protein